MNKELEALETLYKGNTNDVEAEYELLKQALTPPTSIELCDKLSDWFEEEIYFDKQSAVFYLDDMAITRKDNYYNSWGIGYPLPPHLITLIGRFYENEVKVE